MMTEIDKAVSSGDVDTVMKLYNQGHGWSIHPVTNACNSSNLPVLKHLLHNFNNLQMDQKTIVTEDIVKAGGLEMIQFLYKNNWLNNIPQVCQQAIKHDQLKIFQFCHDLMHTMRRNCSSLLSYACKTNFENNKMLNQLLSMECVTKNATNKQVFAVCEYALLNNEFDVFQKSHDILHNSTNTSRCECVKFLVTACDDRVKNYSQLLIDLLSYECVKKSDMIEKSCSQMIETVCKNLIDLKLVKKTEPVRGFEIIHVKNNDFDKKGCKKIKPSMSVDVFNLITELLNYQFIYKSEFFHNECNFMIETICKSEQPTWVENFINHTNVKCTPFFNDLCRLATKSAMQLESFVVFDCLQNMGVCQAHVRNIIFETLQEGNFGVWNRYSVQHLQTQYDNDKELIIEACMCALKFGQDPLSLTSIDYTKFAQAVGSFENLKKLQANDDRFSEDFILQQACCRYDHNVVPIECLVKTVENLQDPNQKYTYFTNTSNLMLQQISTKLQYYLTHKDIEQPQKFNPYDVYYTWTYSSKDIKRFTALYETLLSIIHRDKTTKSKPVILRLLNN